jgi:hypothetical protein
MMLLLCSVLVVLCGRGLSLRGAGDAVHALMTKSMMMLLMIIIMPPPQCSHRSLRTRAFCTRGW